MSTLYTPALSNDKILHDDRQRWRTFCVDHRHWESPTYLLHQHDISWNTVKFERINSVHVPEKTGIYMFVLRPVDDLLANFQHRYIMYVGQATNLRERFSAYFSYANNTKPKDQLKRIMVLIWQDRLHFHFFETSGFDKDQLTTIEYDLIDTVIPPMNKQFRAQLVNQNVSFYAPRK